MNGAFGVFERWNYSSGSQGNDFGHDRDRCLLGRTAAKIDTDGRTESCEFLVGHSHIDQTLGPVVVRSARTHDADVANVGHER